MYVVAQSTFNKETENNSKQDNFFCLFVFAIICSGTYVEGLKFFNLSWFPVYFVSIRARRQRKLRINVG